MFKNLLIVTLAACIVILASACSGGDGGGDSTGAGPTPDESRPDVTIEPSATAAAIPPSPVFTPASGGLVLSVAGGVQDSGLLGVLAPKFEQQTGYHLTTIPSGSVAAVQSAARGEADLVLASAPASERAMGDAGDGVERTLVMHSDFVLIGPEGDPAGLMAEETLDDVLRSIQSQGTPFFSPGSDSDAGELAQRLFQNAGIDLAVESWYGQTGTTATALQAASQQSGYAVSDRATFLAQREALGLRIIFEGTPVLLSAYHVIVVNPARYPNVNAAAARAFAAFVVRPDVQALIAEFGVAQYGEPIFVADAGKPEPGG